MYIEETGGGDGDLRIDTADEHYATEMNWDADGDGIEDAARILTGHGYLSYADEDHDGQADLMRHLDQRQVVLDQSRPDSATGRWLPEQPAAPPPGPSRPADALMLDTPRGERNVGPATEDTNNDGRPDTATVDDGHAMTLATDLDGDAVADQTVRIDDTGDVTVSRHIGPGQWAVVDHRGVDQRGVDHGGTDQRGVGQEESAPPAHGSPAPPAVQASTDQPDVVQAGAEDSVTGQFASEHSGAEQFDAGQPSAGHSPAGQPPAEHPSPGQPDTGDAVWNAADPAVPGDSPERPAQAPVDAAQPDSDALWA